MSEDGRKSGIVPSLPHPLEYGPPRETSRNTVLRPAGVAVGIAFSVLGYVSAAKGFGARAFPWVLVLVPLAKLVIGLTLINLRGIRPALRGFGAGLLWSMLIVVILLAVPILLILGICGGLIPIKIN